MTYKDHSSGGTSDDTLIQADGAYCPNCGYTTNISTSGHTTCLDCGARLNKENYR